MIIKPLLFNGPCFSSLHIVTFEVHDLYSLQAFAGLKQTGKLNRETMKMVKTSRCGNKDVLDEDEDTPRWLSLFVWRVVWHLLWRDGNTQILFSKDRLFFCRQRVIASRGGRSKRWICKNLLCTQHQIDHALFFSSSDFEHRFDMTKNRLMVTVHSKDVPEILPLNRMTKFDFPPHFLVRLMHSFPMMYNTI